MSLSSDEIDRYARHLVLRDIGGPGQLKLQGARVLVVGAGGLGAPLIQYLAAAGIGTIGVVDDDAVSRSNLQRQVIHGTPDIGRPKVESAAEAVARLNPHVSVGAHATRITAENARALIRGYDLVATAPTTSTPATPSPTPASTRGGRWSRRRSGSSTAR
jgi:adenylyltransferase/sulfurtransferase